MSKMNYPSPAMARLPARTIVYWEFEGGGYVHVVIGGDVSTLDAIDMIDSMTAIRRKRIADGAEVDVTGTRARPG